MRVLSGCNRNPSPTSTSSIRRCLFGPAPGGGEDHEIVRIPDQRPQAGRLLPGLVDDVEGDVGQQRRDGRTLGSPRLGVGDHPVLEHPCPQPPPQQLQHRRSTTRRSTWPMRAPWSMLSKHALMSASSTQSAPRLAATRITSSACGRSASGGTRSSSEEVGLEDGFEDDLGRRHDYPVGHRWDAERPGFARLARLGDVDPP